jgi:hypothetical protein
MAYLESDLGHLSAGAVIDIELTGDAANVWLVDSSQVAAYKAGRPFRAGGGHFRRSPITLVTPSSGHWYVMIDHGGLPGNTTASVRVRRAV